MDKVKVILLGESCVGKTLILEQYINKRFYLESDATIIPNSLIKEIEKNNKKIKLLIWDTAGQKRFRLQYKMYLKKTDIALIIYDITNRKSFEELNFWIESVKEVNGNKVLIGIIGNKSDLFEEREVEEEEGMKFAKENNALFFETSAKEYESIENVFLRMIELYLKKKEEEEEEKEEEEKAKKEGKEIIRYDNGDKYIGFLKNNKREKEGKMEYNNGDIYEGFWKNDLKEGEGKMIYNNGDIYEGNWENDLNEGKGKMEYNNGDIYEGNFKNNLKEGEGKMEYNNGDIYKGNFKNNLRNGKGIIYYKSGKIYNGNFINDKRDGNAIITFKNNKEKLEIKFKDDIIIDKGIYTFENGNILIGEFDNNYNIKNGLLRYVNGDEYEGNFDENRNRKGEGKIRNKNGEIYYGEFYNNNEGLFCLNKNDYNILKDKNINDINEIFKLNINDIFYKGKYKNNKKEGEGILYMKKNIFNYKIIYKGNFKEDLKDGFGKIYYETSSIFESNWIKDEINKEKESIFYLTNLNKFTKNNLNKREWINFINMKIFNNIGNINFKNFSKVIIR